MVADGFKIFTSEILNTWQITAEKEKAISEYVAQLSTVLMKKPKKISLSRAEKISCPLDKSDATFKYQPPNAVGIIGGYAWKTSYLKSCCDVDVHVEIPKSCINSKDYLNEEVLKKRAKYLQHVAAVLLESKIIVDVKYLYPQRNIKKPLLAVYPRTEGLAFDKFRVIIHTSLESGTFKLNRFHVSKNNIRKKLYFPDKETSSEEPTDEQPGTPHYNALVLEDLTISANNEFIEEKLKDHESLKRGIILLRIWFERQNLLKGFSSELFISAYVVYLFMNDKFSENLTPGNVFRRTLSNLASSDFKTSKISLLTTEDEDSNRPTFNDFSQFYDVVFIDSTGYFNICHDLNNCLYDTIKFEALKAEAMWASPLPGHFQHFFLTDYSFFYKFDHVVHIAETDGLKDLFKGSKNLQASMLDYCGNRMMAFIKPIRSLLYKALDNRIRLISYLPAEDVEIDVTSKIDYDSLLLSKLTFGLLLDQFNANNSEIKGPSADSHQEVMDFQKLWGEKAGMFRFPNGEIVEAVRWPKDTIADGRTVVSRIVKFILKRHLTPKMSICVADNQLDSLLRPTESKNVTSVSVYGTGEEQHQEVIRSLDELGKAIRSMTDLPLTVTSVLGVSPVFRYAEVFPPVSSTNQYDAGVYNNHLVPVNHSKCPQHVPVFKVLCTMERSGKWPKDPEAVTKVKGAFYIKIADELQKQFGYKCLVYLDKVYLYKPKDTFVLQLEIGIHRSTLTAYLHGLYQLNNSFSCTVRLAKRWMSCQLLSGYIPEEAIELCVAYLYTSKLPYYPPSSPLLGFIQFLQLISTHDWKLDPLFVDLNEEFTETDYKEIRKYFTENRPSSAHMFIATPTDKHSTDFTSSQPTPTFLTRLVMIARASLQSLCNLLATPPLNKQDFKALFRPPTSDYNLLIHLDLTRCSRAHLGVDFCFNSSNPPPKKSSRPDDLFPVFDFDPVLYYLRDLKEMFGEYAFFFYDIYGGEYVAVAWKPSAFKPKPYQATIEKYCKIDEKSINSEQAFMIPDEEAIVTEFQCLGHDLVTRVEVLQKLKL